MATKGKKISEVAEDNKLSQLDGTELVPMAKNGSNAVADVDTIKEYANEGLDDKYVAKEDGKELSSNDYTDEDKNKVDTLENTYLPLSGGTISNSEFGSLEIKRSKDTGHSAAIKFSNNARKLGLIGVYDDDNNNLRYPVFYSVSTTEDGEEVYSAHKLLYANGTSSQFLKADGSVDGTAYLPKSGGTVSSSIYAALNIRRETNGAKAGVAIKYSNHDEVLGYIGIVGTDNSDAEPYFASNTTNANLIWHSGNDGSGSGLDADFLDGHHLTDIVRYEYNPTTEISLNDRRVVGGVDIFDYDYQTADKINNTPFGDKISSAGATYTFGSRFTMQLFNVYNGSSLFFRSLYSGNWTSWHQIAFTDSNVASADKLTTKQLTNEDLNDIKDVNFSSYYANFTNTCTNKPSGVQGFGLQVIKFGTTGIRQVLSSEFIYTRCLLDSGWTEWKKMLTEDDIASLVARVTALENK